MEVFIPLETINFAWFWFITAVVFVVIEVITVSLTTVWFAIGALVLVFLSFLPIPFWIQVLIFLGLSIVLLVLTRPLLVKKLKAKKVHTNVDRFLDMPAVVTKTITPYQKGEVKVDSVLWLAKGEDATLEKGSPCVVIRIEGATAIVRKV